MFNQLAHSKRRTFSLLLILGVALCALALSAAVARPAHAGSQAASAPRSGALTQSQAAGIPHRGSSAPAPHAASRAAAPNVAPQPLDAAPPSGDDSGLWLLGGGLALLLLLEAVSLGLATRAGA